jgi:hypothetical protein
MFSMFVPLATKTKNRTRSLALVRLAVNLGLLLDSARWFNIWEWAGTLLGRWNLLYSSYFNFAIMVKGKKVSSRPHATIL